MRREKRRINETAKVVSSLCRGELSAVETYRQALDKVSDEPAAEDLKRIEAEHEEAVNILRQKAEQFGAEPVTSSGAWGAWAKAVEGTAKVFGNTAALKALKEGEEHGLHDYEDALKSEDLPGDIRELISTTLLPQTREHIPILDSCMSGGSSGTFGVEG